MLTFQPMPHKEARDRIAKLPLVTRQVMDGLLPELRAYAFCITGLDVGDQLSQIRDQIAAVPAGDKTWDKAKKEIAADLDERLGKKEAFRRGELLLRTHVFRSYAAAKYRSLMEQKDIFPFWQYKTHGDGNVRPSHAALNGMIFPAGHPIWQKIFPPHDWGCRCLIVPRTRAQVERMRSADETLKYRIFSDAEATIIEKNLKLPNGISLAPSPTWASAPWSIPGNIRHDWPLIQERYAHDPEALETFKVWAGKTEISPGISVNDWLLSGFAPRQVKAVKAVKGVKAVKEIKPSAPRLLADMKTALSGLTPLHEAAMARHQAAIQTFSQVKVGTPELLTAAAELETAAAELEQVRERARAILEIPAAERGRIDLETAGTAPINLSAGHAIATRFTHASLLPSKLRVAKIGGRAHAKKDTIHIRPDQTASVIAHEITHATEMLDASTLQASQNFLRSRLRAKEVPKALKSLQPGYGYKPAETTLEDHWLSRGGNHYSGKLYFPGFGLASFRKEWRTLLKADPAKAFERLYATEVLTMGIERLNKDPILFAAQDSEYFDFVITTLQKLPAP